MEEYDAFSAGVEAGGLRNRNDIKTLICYLLKKLDKPLTREQLHQVMQDKGLANYFDVSQALDELIYSGNIKTELDETGECLYITHESKLATSVIETDVPKAVREKAIAAGIEVLTKARRERESKVTISPSGDGYSVSFSITDGIDTLLSLSVYAADLSHANMIKENFLKDPVRIYSGIIAALTA